MNVERRRRQLLALINDPGTFEGERDNARRALERLDASAPPQDARAGGWGRSPWEIRVSEEMFADAVVVVEDGFTAFEEAIRKFREAAESPAERARRERWEAESADRQARWRAEAAADELERRFRDGRS